MRRARDREPAAVKAHMASRRQQALKRKQTLTIDQVLAWADAHYQRTGEWPVRLSGAVLDAPGEKWANINQLLRVGYRGLPKGLTLARLLSVERGVPHWHYHQRPPQIPKVLPELTEAQILDWAEVHHESTGDWPNRY